VKYSDLWVRRDTEGERHIIEHIRRNGYISQETLGELCQTPGIGDRVPCIDRHQWAGFEYLFPHVTRKYDPDF
jgi:hypothetical protein